jgi:hypothetical protein
VVTVPIRGSLRPTTSALELRAGTCVVRVMFSGVLPRRFGSASCDERPHELPKLLRARTKTLQLVINAGFRHDYVTQATRKVAGPAQQRLLDGAVTLCCAIKTMAVRTLHSGFSQHRRSPILEERASAPSFNVHRALASGALRNEDQRR